MSITGSIVVFMITWWLILFTILPININSQQEKGNVTEGTDPGAPANPKIVFKLILTTIITTLLFVVIYVLAYFDILNVRELLS